jgi:8-oxo-dGTP diphosphatase
MSTFSIRIYGILINERNEVLLSDESYNGRSFTKFPGGGLEFGEGTNACLKREFLEEFQLEIEVGDLFYLTDFFQSSAFHTETQIISIYYQIDVSTSVIDRVIEIDSSIEKLRWMPLSLLTKEKLTFPIDQHVADLLVMKHLL